ncbi:helix-turn-helix domain-containing protein [Nocardioides sp.]|uniref:helix-turn-helix domain-containing protein n=1 Tax=Nocardioides sp. TaxID=35761 RepID=UPI00378391A5
MTSTETHDLVRWANAAEVRGTRQVGRHAVARVLVQLAVHADSSGIAWPSQETLASEISGVTRRDVRNALAVLESEGLILRVDRRGRAQAYLLAVTDRAGYPANELAGDPANDVIHNGRDTPPVKWRANGRGHGRGTPPQMEWKRTPRAQDGPRCPGCGGALTTDGECVPGCGWRPA